LLLRTLADANTLTYSQLESGRANPATVHHDVTVHHQLACCRHRRGQAQTKDHVVETRLEEPHQTRIGRFVASSGPLDIVGELALAKPVVKSQLLLLDQLQLVVPAPVFPVQMTVLTGPLVTLLRQLGSERHGSETGERVVPRTVSSAAQRKARTASWVVSAGLELK